MLISVSVERRSLGRSSSGLEVRPQSDTLIIHVLTATKAGLSIGIGFIRILFPESQQFLIAKASGKKLIASPRAFWTDLKNMMRQEWRMSIYCIILMTWVSQDSR